MEDNKKTVKFKPGSVKHTFTSNNITSYAGMSPIMKFMRKEKLGHELNELFETEKHNATKFSIAQIMMSVIMASFCGINRVSRIVNFTQDCLIIRLLGLVKSLNKDVVGVRLKRLGQSGAIKLHEFCMEKAKQWLMKSKKHNITLDVDSTVKNVCGYQAIIDSFSNCKK